MFILLGKSVYHSDLMPGDGYISRFAQCCENLSDLSEHYKSLRVVPLVHVDGAQFTLAYGYPPCIFDFFVELEVFFMSFCCLFQAT